MSAATASTSAPVSASVSNSRPRCNSLILKAVSTWSTSIPLKSIWNKERVHRGVVMYVLNYCREDRKAIVGRGHWDTAAQRVVSTALNRILYLVDASTETGTGGHGRTR